MRLREEAETAAAQNTLLSADLGAARALLVGLEKDLLSSHGLSTRLAAERNEARDQLDVARREKAAELESALARREAELKEEYLAEHNAAMGRRLADWQRSTMLSCQGSRIEPGSSDGR